MQVYTITELGAALLQAVVTAGLAFVCSYLYRRHGKDHFAWWAGALGAYALGMVGIVSFLSTGLWAFLYAHQVLIGWTALGFLYAALVFSRQLRWRPWFWGLAAFPVVWSFIAIFVLDDFGLAAGAAVVFLAGTTFWAGVVFWRYRRLTGSPAAGFLAVVLALWAVHHLDYPVLRARGAWNPWGYYLDTLFVLAMGAAVLLLVVEELREGLVTLTALSGDLRRADRQDVRDALLARPLGLRGVRGAALIAPMGDGVRIVRAVGACAPWTDGSLPARVKELVAEVASSGKTRLEGQPRPVDGTPPFIAALALGGPAAGAPVLVIAGDIAAPFSALDESILSAVGAQIGSALAHAELTGTLEQRTGDLERLSVRMISQHEEQRRRLGRELHDETAQVFSALKLQLGSLRETAPTDLRPRFDRLVELVDVGTRSIRSVTEDLRPAVLDDLGLVPALRALVGDFREWSGLAVEFEAGSAGRVRSPGAELALFRALQEALSNVARHAGATKVQVTLSSPTGRFRLLVRDDGTGFPAGQPHGLDGRPGRSGLVGMRERIVAEGGAVEVRPGPTGGIEVEVEVPAETEAR